jgi:predicted phosphodiesterase
MTRKLPHRLKAERLCRKFPDTPSRTLAKRIASECKVTIEQARTAVRQVRGVHGATSRKKSKNKTQYREPKQAGAKPQLPPSLAKKWEPFDLGCDITVAVISDLHIPYHDQQAIEAAVSYLRKRKPDVLLINGDYGDWYSVSRYMKDPKKRRLKREIRMQREGLRWLRSQFPKARIVAKEGNHELRWSHFLFNAAPEVSEFPQVSLPRILGMKTLGIDYVDNQRPIMAGKLPIFHGHELGKGIFSPVNAARGVFMRMISTALVGHHHRTSSHTEPNWRHEEIVCWSTGCLCNLNADYAVINKWNAGFAVVEVDRVGQFGVDNLRLNTDYVVRSG